MLDVFKYTLFASTLPPLNSSTSDISPQPSSFGDVKYDAKNDAKESRRPGVEG